MPNKETRKVVVLFWDSSKDMSPCLTGESTTFGQGPWEPSFLKIPVW